jgi:hypothetical protein
MGSQTIVTNTGQQLSIRTDLSRIFVGQNRYEKGSFLNGTYDPIEFPQGLVIARVNATGYLVPFNAGGNDGSQYPIGVVLETITIDEGDEGEIYYCVAGDVVADKLIFDDDDDDLDSTVANAGGRRVRDLIGAETVGIKLITQNTEMSRQDPND